MFCENCGNQLPEGVKFCPYCGAKVRSDSSQDKGMETNDARQQDDLQGQFASEEHKESDRSEKNWTFDSSVKHRGADGSENQQNFHEAEEKAGEHWNFEKSRDQSESPKDQNPYSGVQNNYAGQQSDKNKSYSSGAQDQNTGNQNAGNQNARNQNTGNSYTGQRNVRHQENYTSHQQNTGYQNTGNQNAGNYYTGQPNAPHQVNHQPRRSNGKNAIIIIGAAIAVVVVIILAVVLHKPTINLSDYVTIEISGYDTFGTASATFDLEQLYQDHEDTIDKALEKQSEQALNNILDLDTLMELLSDDGLLSALEYPGSLDKDSGLSNGDTVTYSFSLSDSDIQQLEDKLGVNIKYKDVTSEVSGLEEVETFDPFEQITVVFQGDDGDGVADVTCEDPDLKSLISIDVEPYDGLSNGEEVEVNIAYGDETDFLDSYGKLPSKTSETVEVSGLIEDISSGDDISDDALDQMKKQSEDLFSSSAANSNGEITLKGTEYQGYYLLINKSEDNYFSAANAVVLVYKLSVSLKAEDDSLTDYQYYAATEFDNLTLDADGNTVVDVTNGYIVTDSFDVEVTPQDPNSWSTSIYLKGYKSLEDMYNSIVTANLADYTVEEHMDVQIDDQTSDTTASSSSSASSSSASSDGSDDLLQNDYIIPDSASRELTDADVEGLTLQEINYAKNEIYARHGRKFKSQELQDYFNSKSWYSGTIEPDDFSDDLLSSVEKANAEFLRNKELAMDPNGYQLDAN